MHDYGLAFRRHEINIIIVTFAFHALGSFQVPLANTSSGSVSGGHVR